MKCLALLTCEKVIIDKDGAHSIINVINNAKIKLQTVESGQPGQHLPIPANAVMPMQWWIYTQWDPTPEDAGREFEQVYQVFWPNGDKLAEKSLSFKQNNDRIQQTSFFIVGFPVGQEGKVRIVTWLHFEGRRASEMMETQFRVDHEPETSDKPNVQTS